MRFHTPSFITGITLTLLTILATTLALAQTTNQQLATNNQPPIAQPLIVNIQQDVPTMTQVEIPNGEDTITATLPITVSVDLQIALNGQDITQLEIITPTLPALVDIPNLDQPQRDQIGKQFTITLSEEDQQDITITEWTAFITNNDHLNISGEIQMLPRAIDFQSIEIIARLYDRNDDLIDIRETSAGSYMEPEQTDRFNLQTLIDVDNIHRYEIQVKIKR